MVRWWAERRSCPVCESEKFRFIGLRGGAAHWRGSGVETAVVKCRSCSLLYQRPTLIPETNPYASEPNLYFDPKDLEFRIALGRRLGEKAIRHLGRPPGRLLEVGCGPGFLLEGARQAGWDVAGLDFTPSFVEEASRRGIDVECAAPADSDYLRAGGYDAIFLFNVLEHLYDPLDALRKCFSALVPGGIVGIGVPNEAGLATRLLNFLVGMHPAQRSVHLSPTFRPFHVVGFSPKSLRIALEQSGYAVEHLQTERAYSHLGSSGRNQKIANVSLNCLLAFAAVVKQGDALNAWARCIPSRESA